MASRNVDLLIKAREDASRAFKSVSNALSELDTIQGKTAQSADTLETALSHGKDSAKSAATAVRKDLAQGSAQAVAVYERIAETVKKATTQFERQKEALAEGREAFAALQKQAEAAATAIRNAEDKVGPRSEAQATGLEAMRKAYADLNREISQAGPRLLKQERQLEQNAAELDRVRSAAAAATAALREVSRSNQRAIKVDVEVQADEVAARAAAAQKRAIDALNASYERQRQVARVSAADQRKLAESFKQAFTSAQQAGTPLGNVYRELVRIGPAADNAARGVGNLTGRMNIGRGAFRAFYGDSRRALSLMQRLRGEVLSLTASFVGFYGVFNVGSGILESFQKVEAAQNRLGAAFDQDYSRVRSEMAYLNAEAARLGISFDVLADNYSKFIISGQQAGLQVEQLRTIFRQVSEAGRVLKLSNDQIEGTFNALIQIAGKGTLQMEELRQQLGDRLPGAVGLLAKALGYGKGELSKFYKDVENGAIGAERALIGLGQGLEDQYGGQLDDALDSVTAKIGELQNLLFQRKVTAANSGFISGLETALDALNAWLDSPEGVEFFEALGAAFGNLFKLLPYVADNMDRLVLLFQAFVAIKAGQLVSGLAAGLIRLTGTSLSSLRVQVRLNQAVAAYVPAAAAALRSTTALGVGLRGLRAIMARVLVTFRAAIASIGGPIGILAAALSAFAFNAMTSVSDSTALTNKALETHRDILREIQTAYREAGGATEAFRKKLGDLTEIEVSANLARLEQRLQELRASGDTPDGRDQRRRDRAERARLQGLVQTSNQKQLVRSLLDAEAAFKKGTLSSGEYLEKITAVREQLGDALPIEIYEEFVEVAKGGQELEEAVAQAEAQLRLLNGTATEADEVLLGLREAAESGAEGVGSAASAFGEYETALRELAKAVPGLNEQLNRFDAIAKIELNFQNALAAARALPDEIARVAAAQEAASKRTQALGALGVAPTQFSKNTVDKIIQVESGGNPSAQNPNSSARGLGQFVESTWLAQFRKHFPVMAASMSSATILALRDDPDISRKMVELLAEDNARFLGQNGLQANDANLYLSHFLGAGGASNLLKAAPGAQVSDILSQDQIAANQSILGGDRTREDVIRWAERKMGITERELAVATQITENRRAQAEQEKAFHDTLQQEISNQEFLNSLEGQRLADAEVAKALREAELEAQKAGAVLSAQEREQIEATTRARYAQAQADEDRNKALEKARALEEQATLLQERRRFLIEQITNLEGQGNFVDAAKLTEDLEGVEEQLRGAIETALKFWRAIGGEGSESAILKLQTVQEEINKTASTAVTTGQQINDVFADKMTAAVASFAQEVAAGKPVLASFKQAFLQMASEILIYIGTMIIRALILKALMSALGIPTIPTANTGDVVAAGVNALVQHGGGVTGQAGMHRQVDPSVFANAVRYHTGGIAGLAPDEIPSILKRNEEVLTESDPRHRFNGGLAGGTRQTKIVNAFDAPGFLDAALASDTGAEVIVNFIKANSDSIRAVLED